MLRLKIAQVVKDSLMVAVCTSTLIRDGTKSEDATRGQAAGQVICQLLSPLRHMTLTVGCDFLKMKLREQWTERWRTVVRIL